MSASYVAFTVTSTELESSLRFVIGRIPLLSAEILANTTDGVTEWLTAEVNSGSGRVSVPNSLDIDPMSAEENTLIENSAGCWEAGQQDGREYGRGRTHECWPRQA